MLYVIIALFSACVGVILMGLLCSGKINEAYWEGFRDGEERAWTRREE